MVDSGYNNNAIRKQKHFKPIANGNVADSGMIVLTDESLSCWKTGLRKDKVWLTLGITIMLLESNSISNQSLMVMLLIVAWLP